MTKITVRDISLSFLDLKVLESVNLELGDHEFCVVLGPSGAGKTTLLRMLLSQIHPTSGHILIDSVPIDVEPQTDRGVVFQKYSVFPHMNVLQNVMVGPQMQAAPVLGRLFGAARDILRERATALLEKVGLGSSLLKYPSQLSGGMQQRLAIAQALIMEPKVLLLDEPFGALDQSTKKSMHKLILELWQQNKMTIVMVTHDIQEAFTLGTRVLMIDRDPVTKNNSTVSTITRDLRLDPSRKPYLDVFEGNGDDSASMNAIFTKWETRVSDAIIKKQTVQ